MSTPLKYMYNPEYFEQLCPTLKSCLPGFDCSDFIIRVFNNEWPEKELKQRVRHIACVLHHFLSKDFAVAAGQIKEISIALIHSQSENGFQNIFLPDYLELHGLHHPDEAFQAMEEVTKLVSAEFAVRPFIVRYPEQAMKYLNRWSKSDHPAVRRLSSEGCRPRLPWAMALPDFKKDPRPILPILENLMQDVSESVRKSVANNLNDIGKDHPQLLIALARKWKGKSPHTDWILRHGCRSLLKKGNSQALQLHGFDPGSQARIRELVLPGKVRIGDYLDFKFSFTSKEKRPTTFRLEYVIDYLTATGRVSTRVFKISEKVFQPGEAVIIRRRQSFRNFTTRKHFPGRHFISIMANGKKLARSEFLVC